MEICYSSAELQRVLAAVRSVNRGDRIGFVPTMGALHMGHISLVKRALQYSNTVVVSIFVNPTQFNSVRDLETYPRAIEEDCKTLREAKATVVFIPTEQDIYPERDTRVFDLGGLDRGGEGFRRPGHFNGVAQVVTRLFDIVRPDYAFFGEKDFQQLSIIRYLSNKLNYPVQIISSPTVREEDGLAMSSRNMLLTTEQREAAPHIYRTLKRARDSVRSGENTMTPSELAEWVAVEINSNPYLETEYVEIVNSLTLHITNSWKEEEIQLCTAVNAGPVRLIDNVKLK